jgi:hypothetical protein
MHNPIHCRIYQHEPFAEYYSVLLRPGNGGNLELVGLEAFPMVGGQHQGWYGGDWPNEWFPVPTAERLLSDDAADAANQPGDGD